MKVLILVTMFAMLMVPMAMADDCFPTCNDDYDEWVNVGKPDGWCFPRQCRGDTDNDTYVIHYDVFVLIEGWKVKEPPDGPGIDTISVVTGTGIWPGINADFDHRQAGSPYIGYYRINAADFNIIDFYWAKGPEEIPANCQDCGSPGGEDWLPQIGFEIDTGSGFVDSNEITMVPHQSAWIGVSRISDPLLYDAYVSITDGHAFGSWTGESWIYDETIPAWNYYGTSPLAGLDTWFVEVSEQGGDGPIIGVNASVEYTHEGCGDTTITLYNEFFEPVDTLVIYGPDIYLESPNGGETLLAGDTYPVRWLSIEGITNVKVEYSADNGSTWQETSPSNAGNTGQYDWLVPFIESTECMVRVSDANDPGTLDTSDGTFTIEIPATITLEYPNGGEELVSGNTYYIEWQSTGSIENVMIEYSDANGMSWDTIAGSTENDGVFTWEPVVESNSDECLVKISDVNEPGVYDTSDELFSLFNCLISIPGDLNNDCYVNLADLVIMSEYWLFCSNPFDPACSDIQWIDNFDDGDVSDWTIESPYPDGVSAATIELSTGEYVSPEYSFGIYSTDAAGGRAIGPDVGIDLDQPYTISFQFRYNNIHWFYMVQFGPVNLVPDSQYTRMRYVSDEGWEYFGTANFVSYCPSYTWTHFRIEVDPFTESYDVYVDDVYQGTANYGSYDTGYRGFVFRDTGTGASIGNGYYDDIIITGKRLW